MRTKIRYLKKGVALPLGFLSSGVSCGIKKNGHRDLSLVISEFPCHSAGTFTTNLAKAAPVLYDLRITGKSVQGVILNSGNANAVTGHLGMKNTVRMARETAHFVTQRWGRIRPNILVCSTGRIGVQLPMENISRGIRHAFLALNRENDEPAAMGIMTSDTVPKRQGSVFSWKGKKIHIGGMAKGAGMIQPAMSPKGKGSALHATMLCVLTTDAVITPKQLQKCLNEAVAKSFNRVIVDGDTSTNDTVLLLSNGQSHAPALKPGTDGLKLFQEALNQVTLSLAMMIAGDGECITRVVTLRIVGAASKKDAETAARAVCNSILVKCSWNGGDPNWGRVLAAIGYSGAKLSQERFHLYYNDVQLVKNGVQIDENVKKARKVVKNASFFLTCDLALGKHQAELHATDLTEKYVEFNRGE